jgi:hypothetical protein
MLRSITGVYTTRDTAERGLRALQELGFRTDDISLFLSGPARELHFPDEPRAANGGAGTADFVNGGLTAVASLSIAAGLFVAGPVGAAVTDAAASGADGMFEVLVSAGLGEDEALMYQVELGRDSILVRVTTRDDDDPTLARHVFESTGGRALNVGPASAPHTLYH